MDAHAFQSGRSAVGRLDERGDIASWRGVVPAGFVTGRPVRLLGGAEHGGNDQMRVVPCRMVRAHGDRQAVGVGDARLHALHGPADQLLGVQAVVQRDARIEEGAREGLERSGHQAPPRRSRAAAGGGAGFLRARWAAKSRRIASRTRGSSSMALISWSWNSASSAASSWCLGVGGRRMYTLTCRRG